MISATKKNRYLWLLQLTKGKNAADGRTVMGGDYEGSLTTAYRRYTLLNDGLRRVTADGKKKALQLNSSLWGLSTFFYLNIV